MPDIVSVPIFGGQMPQLGSAVKRGRGARLVVNTESFDRNRGLDRGTTERSNQQLEVTRFVGVFVEGPARSLFSIGAAEKNKLDDMQSHMRRLDTPPGVWKMAQHSAVCCVATSV